MKLLKNLSVISFFTIAIIWFSACTDSTPKTEAKGPEYTSEYVCPMHCDGSGSDHEGKCPVCEMDYKKNKNK